MLILFGLNTKAQTFHYSLPEKISGKNYEYAVLGKTTEGILIYKFNKYENVLECYDMAMNKKWVRTAEMWSKNKTIQHISISNNNIYVFFSFKLVNSFIVAAQKFTPRLEPIGRYVTLDSVYYENTVKEFDWYVKHSEDKNFYMAYYVVKDNNESTIVQSTIVNNDLKIIDKKNIIIPQPKKNLYNELIDNNGTVYFFSCATEKAKANNDKGFLVDPTMYVLPIHQPLSSAKNLCKTDKYFNSIITKIDNINGTFISAAVAKENTKSSPGFFTSTYSLQGDSIIKTTFEPFTNDMIKEMMMAPEAEIDGFEITDVVVRFDGGLLLFAENHYITQQVIEIPNYYSPAFPTVRTYTYSHFDDVIAQSYNYNGTIEWNKVIRKKQMSENDDGLFSSYGLLKGKNSVQLMYNESIDEQANLLTVTLKANGTLARSSINNSKQKNLLLMPKKASQVSLYEMILPSEYRGYLQFMKIDF
jgi:hypothetical protein